ncbi:MAG TPA: cytidylate kinase-like family protein [Lacunisphaera sp.]
MNASLERTGGYFEAQLRDSRAPWAKSPAPFITISRESCAGGSGLAEILLQKLAGDGWTGFGGNVINQMLAANHLPAQMARFLPEDSVPEVNATIGEMVGLHPSLWELMQKANQTIRQLAKGGHVILVGRGANFATAGLAGGIHVRLIAPVDQRARYFAQRFNVSEAAALAHNAKCDAARRRYVKVHFNAEVADPAAYDLVINTGHVPLTEAADMVITHLRALEPAAA